MAVYIIEDGLGHVKVGKAYDPERRIAEHQTSNPMDLKTIAILDGYTSLENFFHEKLSKFRILGKSKEWFFYTDECKNVIKQLIDSKKNIPKLTFDEFVHSFKNMIFSNNNIENRNRMMDLTDMYSYGNGFISNFWEKCHQRGMNGHEIELEERKLFSSEYGHKWYLYVDGLDPEDHLFDIEKFSRIHDFVQSNKRYEKFIVSGIDSLACFLDDIDLSKHEDASWISELMTRWRSPLYLIPVRCIEDDELFGFGFAIKFDKGGSTAKWVPKGFRYDSEDCLRIYNAFQVEEK